MNRRFFRALALALCCAALCAVFRITSSLHVRRADLLREMTVGLAPSAADVEIGEAGYYRGVAAACGVCAAVASVTSILVLIIELRRRFGHNDGSCAKCGYNLTGNTSGVCPECGTAV